MNLRCIYCQTPFTLGRAEMLAAIVHMHDRNMNHYDAHCPRCRRANSISRQRMELFFPNWQEAAKQQPVAPIIPPQVPVVTAPAAPAPASASLSTEPLSKSLRSAAVSPKGKKVEAKKPAAKAAKASTVKKPAAKKPAAKKTSAKAKPAAKSSPKGKKAPAKGKKK